MESWLLCPASCTGRTLAVGDPALGGLGTPGVLAGSSGCDGRIHCLGVFVCVQLWLCVARLSFGNQSSTESVVLSGPAPHALGCFLAEWFGSGSDDLRVKPHLWFSFQCPDSACKQDLLAYLQRIALYCHQLNICSKVKAEVQNLGGELVVSGVRRSCSVPAPRGLSSRGNNYSRLSYPAKYYRISTRCFGAFSPSFSTCQVCHPACPASLVLLPFERGETQKCRKTLHVSILSSVCGQIHFTSA